MLMIWGKIIFKDIKAQMVLQWLPGYGKDVPNQIKATKWAKILEVILK